MIHGLLTEKAWITAAGLRARVCLHDCERVMTFRVGYVGVPVGHPLHGADHRIRTAALPTKDGPPIPDEVFDVHGGLTFSGERVADSGEGDDPDWWFGFDCAHAGDEWMIPKGSLLEGIRQKTLAEMKERYGPDFDADALSRAFGTLKTLEFCVAQCESLASQIVAKTIVRSYVA